MKTATAIKMLMKAQVYNPLMTYQPSVRDSEWDSVGDVDVKEIKSLR